MAWSDYIPWEHLGTEEDDPDQFTYPEDEEEDC